MIMGFMYYVERENIFYELLRKNNNDLKETVAQIKTIPRKSKDPEAELMRLINEN